MTEGRGNPPSDDEKPPASPDDALPPNPTRPPADYERPVERRTMTIALVVLTITFIIAIALLIWLLTTSS
jgi:hypothetical protein